MSSFYCTLRTLSCLFKHVPLKMSRLLLCQINTRPMVLCLFLNHLLNKTFHPLGSKQPVFISNSLFYFNHQILKMLKYIIFRLVSHHPFPQLPPLGYLGDLVDLYCPLSLSPVCVPLLFWGHKWPFLVDPEEIKWQDVPDFAICHGMKTLKRTEFQVANFFNCLLSTQISNPLLFFKHHCQLKPSQYCLKFSKCFLLSLLWVCTSKFQGFCSNVSFLLTNPGQTIGKLQQLQQKYSTHIIHSIHSKWQKKWKKGQHAFIHVHHTVI